MSAVRGSLAAAASSDHAQAAVSPRQLAPAAWGQQRQRRWRAAGRTCARCLPQQPCRPSQQQHSRQRPLGHAPAATSPSGERNPQNVDQPRVLPSPDFSAEEAVAVQLDALACNDEPWGNHGVQTMYEFANDVGGLDPSMYFGYRKDLYHLDHFQGMFVTRLGALVGHGGYSLAGAPRQADEETVVVTAEVQPSAGAGAAAPQRFDFHLRRKRVGPRKGAWTTWMLVAADGEAA